MRTLEDLLRAWADAEARGDAAALDALLAADFRGDGPAGFVLGKRQWLDRHRRGELTVGWFAWTAVDVRARSRSAVATGTLCQVARDRGRDCGGASVCTIVAVRRDGAWRIVNLQLGRARPHPGHLADVRPGPPGQAGRERRRSGTHQGGAS
jgi:Domain of unknown function (DUF4440)